MKNDNKLQASKRISSQKRDAHTSRIPGFYRLSVEQRLAYLQRNFGLSDEQLTAMRNGSTLSIEHAVNMVENAVGVLGMPLGLGLNFLVNNREYIVPMAIEEASIIAAASKGALIIRSGGGFTADVDDPIMIGQIQVMDLQNPEEAAEKILAKKSDIIEQANLANIRMVARGGGVFDLETRVVDGGEDVGKMLIVHLLMDVREAMGANAINYACEAAGPSVEEITGGRVNLRILSNYANRRLARARFSLPYDQLATKEFSGRQVAQRMVEAGRLALVDPFRATTHNKGVFNGIGAAALALGQDWRAIEAGGHAYAAESGTYKSLTDYRVEGENLCGSIELPLQVGWVGGAVNSHPGIRLLRQISGVQNAKELACLLAAVGLAQNFAACLALSTVGIQQGHMALHARSVAISIGVPPNMIEEVAQEMINRGEVKVAVAEQVFREMKEKPKRKPKSKLDMELPRNTFAPGKVVLFGEHSTVYGYPGITATIDVGLTLRMEPDENGPRFVQPQFKQLFNVPKSDQDIQLFTRAVDKAIELYDLEGENIAISVKSDLVPGMGLGSSAAFSAALCMALRHYKHLETPRHWDSGLFDDVQQLESIFHGHPSGMDAATVLSDGVLWFRKGPPREILPIRLPVSLHGVVVLVEPGARTIELVRRVRQSRDLNPKRVDKVLEEIGNLTTDAGISLGMGDEVEIGRLMFRNHELLGRLGVSTPGLDDAVADLLEHGALGAKLTGSGGGGAVIALTTPEQQEEIVQEFDERYAMAFPFTLRKSI